MVNVYIYLETDEEALLLTKLLLQNNLAAHVSIDTDNKSFYKIDGKIVQKTNVVLTLQTKALLFNNIEELVNEKLGNSVKIYSLPITQCNATFAEAIRNSTKKI